MVESLLADSLVSGAGEKVAAFVVKCLAVAGAFLIGYFVGGAVAWALDRWVFAKKAPEQLKKAVSIIAGVALAILVALIVFGDGGNGMFGRGGGSGDGKGTPSDDGNNKQTPAPPEPKKPEDPPKKDEPPKPTPKPTPGDLRVTIRVGDEVKDDEYYLIGDDPTPKSFEDFKKAIEVRRKTTDPELKTVFYRFNGEPLSITHKAVSRPYAWLDMFKIPFAKE